MADHSLPDRMVYAEIYRKFKDDGLDDLADLLRDRMNFTDEEILGPLPYVTLAAFSKQYFGGGGSGPVGHAPVDQVPNMEAQFIPLANLHPDVE